MRAHILRELLQLRQPLAHLRRYVEPPEKTADRRAAPIIAAPERRVAAPDTLGRSTGHELPKFPLRALRVRAELELHAAVTLCLIIAAFFAVVSQGSLSRRRPYATIRRASSVPRRSSPARSSPRCACRRQYPRGSRRSSPRSWSRECPILLRRAARAPAGTLPSPARRTRGRR